jgi:hypothetical protein
MALRPSPSIASRREPPISCDPAGLGSNWSQALPVLGPELVRGSATYRLWGLRLIRLREFDGIDLCRASRSAGTLGRGSFGASLLAYRAGRILPYYALKRSGSGDTTRSPRRRTLLAPGAPGRRFADDDDVRSEKNCSAWTPGLPVACGRSKPGLYMDRGSLRKI